MLEEYFNFRVKSEPNLIYSAKLLDDGDFEVTWEGLHNCIHSMKYNKESVLKHLSSGDWIKFKAEFKSISIDTKAEQVHSPKYDVVNNPKHYQLVEGFEVKDLMRLLLNRIENSDTGFTHFQSSCYKEAMQYFLRFMLKNGQEDIQKGVYYMNEVLKEWENK